MARKDRIGAYNKLTLDEYKAQVLQGNNFAYKTISNSYTVTFETVSTISQEDLDACFDLIAYTSKSDYEQSAKKWRPHAKKVEMKDSRMRYLLVHESSNPKLHGFTSFMLDYEDGIEVVYLYEIHLIDEARGVGLGKYLIDMVFDVGRNAKVAKMMLTVFNRNAHALAWYARLGFVIDEYSPAPRTLRNGIVKEADYKILSKVIPA